MSWREIAFGDFAEVQPQVKLEKGTAYSFIEMSNVEPHTKSVDPRSTRIWKGSGGAKFENGDVIFARITPCLEHGKAAKVDNLTDSRGFGSTEFFVFRGQGGISDPDYIYYLACSPVIREPAIKSMIGSSGRQRAQKVVLENTIIQAPEIQEQRRIASLLSAYDDLIENNRRRIGLLEQAARLLYREWFVHLRFPGHEHVTITDGVPEGWEKGTVADFFDTTSGGTPSRKRPEFFEGDTNWVKTQELNEDFIFETDEKITTEALSKSSAKLFPSGTLLVSIYGGTNIGRTGILAMPSASNQACVALFPRHSFSNFIFAQLFFQDIRETLIGIAQGSAQTNISQQILRKVPMLMPSKTLMQNFLATLAPVYDQLKNLKLQNVGLEESRNFLLPRLMNGKVAV